MRKILSAAVFIAFGLFGVVPAAFAQGPMNCNVSTADPSYSDGQTRACSQDVTGHIRTLATTTVPVAPLTTTELPVTVAVTNTFQQALAASGTRKGCTIQYIAVAGSKGFVFFGSSTPGSTATSFQLGDKQALNCAVGGLGVATDQVLVTGTATDIFIVSNQ